MADSANDNAYDEFYDPDRVAFEAEHAAAAQGFDWAEELTARPRLFAPSARFYGEDQLVVALWWAARRHSSPFCFIGRDDWLVTDMRPARDAEGRVYLEGWQLNDFVEHLSDRADGALLSLVYLRPHPDKPAMSLLQAAIAAVSGRQARARLDGEG